MEAARSDALARQQQAAAAAHLIPHTPENPQQASQWARFIEQQALAAAQQHNAAAAAAQHNQPPHGAPPRRDERCAVCGHAARERGTPRVGGACVCVS